MNKQRVLVTGANGFIAKNLIIRLGEQNNIEVLPFVRGDGFEVLTKLVATADSVVHLAGESRPNDVANFVHNNVDLTSVLCHAIQRTGRNIPLFFSSSVQAQYNNHYGQSKRAAEEIIAAFVAETASSAIIYRFAGVFGKFCKPNYNSVVATFCYNIARDLPIHISDPDSILELCYIDDLVDELLLALGAPQVGCLQRDLSQIYRITVGDLADQIAAFKDCRSSLILERVGKGLTRALYATYVSYLPPEKFVYNLKPHADERGMFVEMLKTPDCGQFSFFTISPGVTRGSHYHHSKTEKFLVVSGAVRVRCRHLVTGETFEAILSSERQQVMETIPGWVHDVTNMEDSDAIIVLWANEIFTPQSPDCIPCEV
jgi:UDP-2-acetamido-2,6-beta-L-arabino-hexul-4-ose reductase